MNSIKEVQIKDFNELSNMSDNDILYIMSNGVSYKITGDNLSKYISEQKALLNKFLLKEEIGESIAPLNSENKIDSQYLNFGKVKNTVYSGDEGAIVESSINSHTSNTSNPHNVTKEQIGLGSVDNKNSETIRSELTFKNVTDALGFTPEIEGVYEQSTAYTDNKIAELIDGAPETLDTLKELADAMQEYEEVTEAINKAIGEKADQLELDAHTGNNVIHVTQTDKNNIATALSHSNSEHARSDATKTEKSETNGNIKINDTETVVYEHPLSGVTAGTYRQVTVDSNGHIVAGNNTTLPLSQGGTGATTASDVLVNLGLVVTADEMNKLSGADISTTEINYLKGTTSNIQSQLDEKAQKTHGNHVPIISESTNGNFLKSNGTTSEWGALTADEISNALGYVPGTGSNVITAVKGDAETEYQTGNYNITPEKIGLGNVDNTHDNEKSVLSASKLTTARKIGNASFNGSSDITLEQIGIKNATTTESGLITYDDKIKLDNTNIAYGTCSTTAGTAEKEIVISENSNWKLEIGSIVVVKFTVTNTASNCTLNVNNTGAKSIWYNNAKYTGNSNLICGYANRYCLYMYDGTNWIWMTSSVDNNTWTKFKGATSSADGTAGYVPAPTKGNQNKFFRADGTWQSLISEIISSTEPTSQSVNDYWLKPL